MTIASEISKLSSNLADSYTAVSTKGGTLPDYENFDNLPTAIESIPTGGGTTYPGLDTDYTNGLATINKGALDDYSISDVTETGCIAKYTNVYNNFKIFGNPTINFETGVVGGFGESNYLNMPKAFPSAIGSVDMIFKGVLTDVTSAHSMILEYNGSYSFCIRYNTSKFSCYVGSWVDGTNALSTNTWYWFRVTFDGTTWRGYTLVDDDYILSQLPDISQWRQEWTTTTSIPISGNIWEIGTNQNARLQYFHGSLNLSQAVIYVNGAEWWNAKGNSAVVKNYIYSNYTTVGSPIIDVNTGLVKGFSTSNYIRIPNTFPSSISSADIIFKGRLDALSVDNPLIMQNRGYGCRGFYVTATGYFGYYDGTYTGGTHLLSTNKWYWFRIVLDNTYWRWYSLEDDNYTLETLPDISNWQYENQRQTDSFSSNVMNIGLGYLVDSYKYWHGSIDLSQCIVKLNGNTWWNAKSSNYQQTYGLLNTSIPSGTPELQINYNPVDRNYALGERNDVVASIVGNKSYVWGNGGLLNFSGYSNYPSYSISPNWGFVGTPTYNSSDMSYSGFNPSNYIRTSYDFLMSTTQFAKGFTIQMHIKTPSSWGGSSDHNWVFSQDGNWQYYSFFGILANAKASIKLATGGSELLSMSSSSTLSTNTEYWIRVVKPDTRYFPNDTVMQISTDGENWTTDATASVSSISTDIYNGKLRVGAYDGTWYMRGAVYLDGTFIDFNNGDNTTTRVWSLADKTQLTPEPTPPTRVYDNFTTVGSPTINQSTGVVNDFDPDNYLKLPQVFNPSSNTWEIMFKVKYDNSYVEQWLLGSGIWGQDYQGFAFGCVFDQICFYLSSNGESWDEAQYVHSETTLSNGDELYMKLEFTGSEYIAYSSTDGITWTEECRHTSSTPVYASLSPLGLGANLYDSNQNISYWHGSIDLSESYIKINNNLWWVGYTES